MKIVSNVGAAFKAFGYTLTQGWRGNFPTTGTGGGVFVIDSGGNLVRGPVNAYGLSAFFACLRVVSEDVAKMPVRVYRKTSGDREYLEEHLVHDLIGHWPNRAMSAQGFREAMTVQAMASGNAFAMIQFVGGAPVALWPVNSSNVQGLKDVGPDGAPILVYVVTSDKGAVEVFFESEMFHLRGLGDGLLGYNIMQLAAETLSLTKSANQYASTFFNSGGRPAGLLSVDESLSQEMRTRLKEEIKKTHGGADNTNKILVLDKGMSFTPFGVPPETSQMIQTRRFQAEEICRFLRVPLHKIMDTTGISYNAMEQMEKVYATDTLEPWLGRWESEIERKLLSDVERETVRVRHDLHATMKGTHRDRADFYQKMFQTGALTPNEIRAREDMDPLPGGDNAYTQVNVAPVGMSPPEMLEKRGAQPPPPANNPTQESEE